MIPYSKSIYLIWQLAAAEAHSGKRRFIEIEHIFIGLLRAGDALDEKYRKQFGIAVNEEDMPVLRKELSPVDEPFAELAIDKVRLRRHIRGLLGKGDSVYDGKVIHRSEKCKGYFSQAEHIAAKAEDSKIKPIYLLKAIIDNPSTDIEKALTGFNCDIDDFRRVLRGEKVKAPVGGAKAGALQAFGVDLTRLAREGKIEPLIGRKEELLKIIRTLTRKTKNNPVLIGKAGVGKTAIVKGFALRIAQKKITPQLQGKKIIELNIAGIIAGTKYRGEFEEKLLRIINEAKKDSNVILFLDEIHTIVDTGSTGDNALDVANIMKPVLASGEIKCIGATTIDEYRKYIEKDPALERRFLPVMIDEPTEEETINILMGLKKRYEKHHNVEITDDAIEAAVRLSVQYISDRQLPDKAIDVLDESCSRVTVKDVSYCVKPDDVKTVAVTVTEQIVAEVVSDWTGVPVEKNSEKEKNLIVRLEEELNKRIIGQEGAVKKVVKVIKILKAGMRDSNKPSGVFLFTGQTGVGKTELAKAIAESLFGSENALIRFDMSEFMEQHSVSKLVGSPPGYVGYEEEGQLTARLRTKPYSVVLFDEIEKAHNKVLDLFLQLFDEGRITDAKGKTVNAKNAIFIMTSNVETEQYRKKHIGFGNPDEKEEGQDIRAELKGVFRAEFLNRIDEIIPFLNLDDADAAKIVALMLDKLANKLKAQEIFIEFSKEAIKLIAKEGYDSQFGARPIARTIEQLISIPISEKIINGELKTGGKVIVKAEDGKILFILS
ncbi:MAG: ATP-dependent Clp protease ATP-binding subunit [Prolixibacteraceae bacterium]|nr:ATP-dependent Clp protease ATP-binding subunit [Prolixibacteraceae bacterium]